ncbi:MAG: ABC transporter substrate-binding protein [Gammaproteobacteria bacterium]|nr:ABC transporter substrate-binding protein [Gammaproteobacteria bacterium]
MFWNLRKERFQDIRVREALWWLYDFEFTNRVIYYDYYERGRSLFHGAPEMAARGLPSGRERELLEPYRDQLPERVFTQPYEPPENDGYGIKREYVERALRLFEEAGWVLDGGRLVNNETGERFTIDFILVSHSLARSLLPYSRSTSTGSASKRPCVCRKCRTGCIACKPAHSMRAARICIRIAYPVVRFVTTLAAGVPNSGLA